jgi:RimJ/RimL family protein N-acetyltransferase
VRRFTAKVGCDNEGSQALFRRLGFREVDRVDVFREVTLEWSLDADSMNRMQQQWEAARKTAYDEESPGQQTQTSLVED